MSSNRESRRIVRRCDFPTAVGPKRTTTSGGLSGVRVAIPDLLSEDLLQGRGDDLPLVGVQLVISGEVDLDTALHSGTCHFVYVSLEAFQEIEG
jgi:hypothetical protein